MNLSAESLLDRIRIKKQVGRWRTAAILLAIFLGIALLSSLNKGSSNNISLGADHIARIEIEGLIVEDNYRDKVLRKLRNDKSVKGVVVAINSPGGTIVGGESLYRELSKISLNKPTVTTMGSIATSGGYMAAVGTNHIFAYSGTLTGSIGVLLQSGEATELAEKIGVTFHTFKSGSHKGSPSPFEKLTPDTEEIIQESVNDAFNLFIDMVTEGRKQLTREQVLALADGRVFIGQKAYDAHLIDAIGGEEEAITWLQGIIDAGKDLPVKDISIEEPKKGFDALLTSLTDNFSFGAISSSPRQGVMALWQPDVL